MPRAVESRSSGRTYVEHAAAYQQELEVFWRPARHTDRLLTAAVTQTFRPPHTCQSVGEPKEARGSQVAQKS